MIIRELQDADLAQLVEIQKGHDFQLRSPSAGIPVVEDKFGIVAVGQFLPMMEWLIMENYNRSKHDRVAALRALMIEGMHQNTQRGYTQAHVFVKDPKFAAILKKHWGFIPCSGEALVLNF